MSILFYKVNEDYGCFSNFAHYGFELDGRWWMTSEHYFQAQKFCGTMYEEIVRKANNPMKAAELGRKRDLPLRKDWEYVKDEMMRKAVYAKFSQNKDIKEILLNTYPGRIVDNTLNDYYWGCGADGSGKNMLGKILMEVREVLRKEIKS